MTNGLYFWEDRMAQHTQINIQSSSWSSELKNKNRIINSTDPQKTFAEVQHPFMIKSLQKLELEVLYLNIINTTSENPIANIILVGVNEEYFLEMNYEIKVSTLSIPLLRHFLKSSIELRKEGKLSLFADDMVLDLKFPPDFNKNLLELINPFSKVTQYKLVQKPAACLCTCNKAAEKNQRGMHTTPSTERNPKNGPERSQRAAMRTTSTEGLEGRGSSQVPSTHTGQFTSSW